MRTVLISENNVTLRHGLNTPHNPQAPLEAATRPTTHGGLAGAGFKSAPAIQMSDGSAAERKSA